MTVYERRKYRTSSTKYVGSNAYGPRNVSVKKDPSGRFYVSVPGVGHDCDCIHCEVTWDSEPYREFLTDKEILAYSNQQEKFRQYEQEQKEKKMECERREYERLATKYAKEDLVKE